MKLAITCESNQVFQHFGHTPEFAVFTVEDGKITAKEIISCGETGHGALAGLLANGGIDLLICGGIGGGAQMALAEAGIQLIGGASGNVDEVAAAFVNGTLAVNANFHCNHHHDHGEGHSCGSHGCGSSGHSCGGSCH
ncbi:MAG: dinitrogenase iron-molybdenum cofactor biosynthesis protein [Lentisphaeria bacterium]|nr:dinitrogenase iron-molybdenum cofactor biosynthesis protein [Lentisphaeria bacterium]